MVNEFGGGKSTEDAPRFGSGVYVVCCGVEGEGYMRSVAWLRVLSAVRLVMSCGSSLNLTRRAL